MSILSLPLAARLWEAEQGEERLNTFFPQTILLSLHQAPAGLLQCSEMVAGCSASLVDGLVPMQLQAAGQRCVQGSGVQSGMLA